MILNFIGKKKSANLFFFFSVCTSWEKQDFFKNPFSKALDFPHVFQHHVGGTTVTTLDLRGQVIHSIKMLT